MPVIPCLPLASLLSRFGIFQIDFLSLDVEGAELAVLKSLNFNHVRIKVMCIETERRSATYVEEMKQLLTRNDYIWLGTFANDLHRNSWVRHASYLN
jgi:hypothetical protein